LARPEEAWLEQVEAAANVHHQIHAVDAENECAHGRLPTDQLRHIRCQCWDHTLVNKSQGKELQAEFKALKATMDQMNLLLQALWREQQGVAKRANGKARV
jgi:hypothetical protein